MSATAAAEGPWLCWTEAGSATSAAGRPLSSSSVSQVVLVGKDPPAEAGEAGDSGSLPALGSSPGEGHGNPLQYSCMENTMDRGTWQATINRVAKSQTRLTDLAHT